MLVVASMDGNPWKIVSVAIYGFTLLVLYSASTENDQVAMRYLIGAMKSVSRF